MRPDQEAAFTDFAAASIPRLRRMAFAWTHDWVAADDAVQGTLEKMIRSWHRMDERDPHFYARKVLLRVLISDRRKPWRWRENPSGLDYAAHLPDGPANVDDRDILAVISALSPMQRSVVVLRYIEDLSVRQTANILGCSEGNVKRHAHSARQRLAPLVSSLTPDEPSQTSANPESSQQ